MLLPIVANGWQKSRLLMYVNQVVKGTGHIMSQKLLDESGGG
jgi:hypothetical protein